MTDNFQNNIVTTILIFIITQHSLHSSVIISEIMPNPKTRGEWIEIYNDSEIDVYINSWKLVDLAGNIGLLPDDSFVIPAYSFAILAQDINIIINLQLAPDNIAIFLQGWAAMNNDGDELTLQDRLGNTISHIFYGSDAAKVKGTSWERISLADSGNDPANWGQCASLAGHTAGKSNSLYVTNGIRKIDIHIEPNPFSPDGDDIDDVATISFTLPFNTSRLSAYVYDLDTNLIYKLASDIPAGPKLPTLQWSGRSSNGNTLPVGRYIIYVESLDYQTGSVTSGKKVIVLASNK